MARPENPGVGSSTLPLSTILLDARTGAHAANALDFPLTALRNLRTARVLPISPAIRFAVEDKTYTSTAVAPARLALVP